MLTTPPPHLKKYLYNCGLSPSVLSAHAVFDWIYLIWSNLVSLYHQISVKVVLHHKMYTASHTKQIKAFSMTTKQTYHTMLSHWPLYYWPHTYTNQKKKKHNLACWELKLNILITKCTLSSCSGQLVFSLSNIHIF